MKTVLYSLAVAFLFLSTFLMIQGKWEGNNERFTLGFLIFILVVLFYLMALLKAEQWENRRLKEKIEILEKLL